MQTIYHPAASGEPGPAVYGIYIDHSKPVARAVIVAGGLFLWNVDYGRNAVLNRIIANDLPGVRIQFIRFIAVPDWDRPKPTGKEFVIFPDLKQYRKQLPLIDRRRKVSSTELLGGFVSVSTIFDQGVVLKPADTMAALKAAGLR